MRLILRSLVLATLLTMLVAAPASAATGATDPTGDNSRSGLTGPDITGVSDQVDPDGTAHVTVARTGTDCSGIHDATPRQVQPMIQFMAAGATAPSETGAGNAGAAYAATGDNPAYIWSPLGGTGSDTDVPLDSFILGELVVVTIPAAQIAAAGGLPLRYWVSNSCRSHWSDPVLSQSDIAPDSGLYTLEAYDACPNLDGTQTSVPAGLFVDAAGNCVVDACPNLAGNQATVPSTHGLLAGSCVPKTIAGGGAANLLVGNALANLILGRGGNDRLFGRAGNDTLRGGFGNDVLLGELGRDRLFGDAGADTARGGAGADVLVGGPARDRLYGDAGNDVLYANDRARGDLVNGGAGRDTCWYDAGDVLVSCERRIRRR